MLSFPEIGRPRIGDEEIVFKKNLPECSSCLPSQSLTDVVHLAETLWSNILSKRAVACAASVAEDESER